MFNNLKLKISPTLALRVGLGGVFLYAGIYILLDPSSWIRFIPSFIENIMPNSLFLIIYGFFEVALGGMLIMGIFDSVIALIAFLNLSAIILFNGYSIDNETFRDFGLLMASLSLFLITKDKKF